MTARRKVARDFESTYRAYKSIKHETGLLYIHSTSGALSVGEINIDGCLIETKHLPFTIQKRSTLIADRLNVLSETNNKTQMRQTMGDVADFINSLWMKGWVDTSMFFHHNIGYMHDNSLIQIDTGDFLRKDTPLRHKNKKADQYIDKSSQWLEENFSFLRATYEKRMKSNLKNII
jgi:hypothetical protein